MILPFIMMDFTDAQKIDEKLNDADFAMVDKHKNKIEKQLKQSDKDRIFDMVKKDKKTSQYFEDKDVTYESYSYTGNVFALEQNPNKPLDIVMHYTADGESLTVLMDGETKKIVDSLLGKTPDPLLPDNGLIINGRIGSYDIKGMRIDYKAPDWTPTGTGWTAMLVNAAKQNSYSSYACTKNNSYGTYWAQSGLLMNQNGLELVWADTGSECIPKYFTTNQNKARVGDSIISQITVNPDTNLWVLYGYNFSTGDFYAHPQTVSETTKMSTNTSLTNVFFENPNSPSKNWDPQFSSDPKIDRAYDQKLSGGWDYWSDENEYVVNCDPGGKHHSQLASGSLANGNSITYDVGVIQPYCGV